METKEIVFNPENEKVFLKKLGFFQKLGSDHFWHHESGVTAFANSSIVNVFCTKEFYEEIQANKAARELLKDDSWIKLSFEENWKRNEIEIFG